MNAFVVLRTPDTEMLPSYVAALEAGWSPSTVRDVCAEHLAEICADPAAFLADRQEGAPGMVTLQDGRVVPRLPGPIFWISDGEFCGQINLRYQPGTLDLPAHVSGHVGYAVVPWRRRRGIATAALRLLLPIAASRGLPKVMLTCDTDNVVSRRVIEACGGVYERTVPDPEHESVMKLVFWLSTG